MDGWLVSYLIEALWLWVVTAGVVVVTSIIHYIIATARIRDLHARIEEQRQLQQPRNDTRDRPMEPA